ncbi:MULTISPECIES: helix-turn-helix domain-containing protein [Halorussus]|uniref:helix-turn-helix domain-containing protein n=1 Tax=Halorussus TaxID=1070314 RepID=UPI00209D1063|nr:helix-turn-helix domain-containing protein [Halorussus vallis]USZ78267.1 helix-turn-helix domain-containing protein [Halorussus vallis]
MSILAEFTVSVEEFLLGDALGRVPEVGVVIERVVAEDRRVTPYFWADGERFEAFEAAMESDPTVDDVRTLETHDRKRFYRASWSDKNEGIAYAVSETDATVLRAEGTASGWSLRALFPEEGSLSSFHEFCSSHGLDFELSRLYESRNPEALGKYDVTEKQREALTAAVESEYFSVPRGVTLKELAGDLDISPNALSTRLRRGHQNLITNTLCHDAKRGGEAVSDRETATPTRR